MADWQLHFRNFFFSSEGLISLVALIDLIYWGFYVVFFGIFFGKHSEILAYIEQHFGRIEWIQYYNLKAILTHINSI